MTPIASLLTRFKTTLTSLLFALCLSLVLSACGSTPVSVYSAGQDLGEEAELPDALAEMLQDFNGDPRTLIPDYIAYVDAAPSVQLYETAFQAALGAGAYETAMHLALDWSEMAESDDRPFRWAAQLLMALGEPEAAWFVALDAPMDGRFEIIRTLSAEVGVRHEDENTLWYLDQVSQYIDKNRYHSDELWMALAILELSLDRATDAYFTAERVRTITPTYAAAVQIQVESLIKMDQADRAVDLIETWMLTYWDASEEHERVMRMLVSLPEVDAGSAFSALMQAYPDVSIRLSAAQFYVNHSDLDAAIGIYEELRSKGERRNLANYQLGRIYEYKQDSGRALMHYQSVTNTDSFFADANERIGVILLREFGVDEVRRHYANLRQLTPEIEELAYQQELRLVGGQLSDDKLYELLNTAVTKYPNNEDFRYSRSMLSERHGDLASAEVDLQHVLAVNPRNASALNALGYMLTNKTDRHEEAYVLIESALRLEPEEPAILDSMGWVLYHQGYYEASLNYLLRAHAVIYDEEIVSHLVQVYIKLGQFDEAEKLLAEALARSPSSTELQALEALLYANQSS